MAPPPSQSRFRTRLFRLLRCLPGLVMVLLLFWALALTLLWSWVAKPPPLPAKTQLDRLAMEVRDGRRQAGPNWFDTIGGLNVLYLEGAPVEIGYANAVLTGRLMHRQEDALVELVNTFIPRAWAQDALKFILAFHTRRLPDHLLPEHRLELLGLALGCPDLHPEMGPYYHRLLNYHAAHDISHLAVDRAWLSGCTAFGAWGPTTRDGRLLAGRNFDWEAAPVFDRDRVLLLCRPEGGIPFVSLAWAGMIGVVSGMNQAGVAVTLNGARGKPPTGVGTPIALVARQVLQEARDLDDAIRIVSNATVFVSELFLVGSRADGRFIVIEKTPSQTAVREGADSRIVCANHFETPALRNNPNNLAYLADSTSPERHARASELLAEASGSLDPARTAAILRDRCLAGGMFAGNGHRAALNALIATHAVVMDLTDGIFWAAAPPHQLGAFVAVDLATLEITPSERWLPADPMLRSGEYTRYTNSVHFLAQARAELRAGAADQALTAADQAAADNPGFYKILWARADALLRLGRTADARTAYQAALDARPAFPSEQTGLRAILTGLDKQAPLGSDAGGRNPSHP
jgi:tetratricopeptide (TPR) repeat protein